MMESMIEGAGHGPEEQEGRRKQSETSQSDQLISCSSTVKKKKNIEDKERYLSNHQSSNTDSSVRLELPREIIYEILTRVSLNQLVCQFPSLSKELRSLTCGSNLKHLHSRTTPTLYGYVIEMMSEPMVGSIPYSTSFDFISFNNNQSPSTSKIRTLNFLPDSSNNLYHFQIVSSSSPHGLFCCMAYRDGYQSRCFPEYYCICKPATGEFQMIPVPSSNTNCFYSKIVIDVIRCSPLHYKIFRFSAARIYRQDIAGLDMFDSQRGKWATLETTANYSSLPRGNAFLGETGVIVHGAINWLTENGGQICSLNIREYTWKVLDTPKDEELQDMIDSVGGLKNKLVECEGELGLMILSSSRRWLELWVLQNAENVTWKKNYRVSLEPIFQNWNVCLTNVLDYYTTDIVLMKINDDIIWFDCKSGSYSIAKKNVGLYFWRVHKIHSDFVPCNISFLLRLFHVI